MTSNPFAFPRPLPEGKFVPDEAMRILRDSAGMTLRDYFAAAALPSVIAACLNDTVSDDETPAALFARNAYFIADAMLMERAK